MEERAVVTCFLRDGTEVLLCRRSDAAGSDRGRWGAVSGYAAGASDGAARRAIREAVGPPDAVEFVRSAGPLAAEDAERGVRWLVHPYLFECDSTALELTGEVADREWVQPPAILERTTVPRLWETYAAVAPTVDTVREDADHGSAYVSLRALEVLRDRAAEAAARDAGDADLGALAREIRTARPSMGVVANRINRVMARTPAAAPAAVRDAAVDACRRAVRADEAAAANAADRLGERVLTLSRSGTVLEALRRADPEAVFVAESRPAREGVGVAEELAEEGVDVALFVDAAAGSVLATEAVETVLVGADSVLADGSVVNKVGTHLAALAAAATDVDCYAVCARDKVVPASEATLESGPPEAVYDGDAPVDVLNPTFETVPADRLDGVVTEDGLLARSDLEATADEHAALAEWDR